MERAMKLNYRKVKHPSKCLYPSGEMRPTCEMESEESKKGLQNTVDDGVSSPPLE